MVSLQSKPFRPNMELHRTLSHKGPVVLQRGSAHETMLVGGKVKKSTQNAQNWQRYCKRAEIRTDCWLRPSSTTFIRIDCGSLPHNDGGKRSNVLKDEPKSHQANCYPGPNPKQHSARQSSASGNDLPDQLWSPSTKEFQLAPRDYPTQVNRGYDQNNMQRRKSKKRL